MSASTHERLKARLELMRSANAQGFDAPAFTYIETLVERSKDLPHGARIELEELARFRLSEYQMHFNEARADVESLLEDLDLTEEDRLVVNEHFQRCDFKGLTRYIKSRMRDTRTIFQRNKPRTDLLTTFGSAEELAQLDLLAELESGNDESDESAKKPTRLRHRSPLKLLREHAAAEKNRLRDRFSRFPKSCCELHNFPGIGYTSHFPIRPIGALHCLGSQGRRIALERQEMERTLSPWAMRTDVAFCIQDQVSYFPRRLFHGRFSLLKWHIPRLSYD